MSSANKSVGTFYSTNRKLIQRWELVSVEVQIVSLEKWLQWFLVHGHRVLSYKVRILKCVDNGKPLMDCRTRDVVRFPLQSSPTWTDELEGWALKQGRDHNGLGERWWTGRETEGEPLPLNPQDPWSLHIEQWQLGVGGLLAFSTPFLMSACPVEISGLEQSWAWDLLYHLLALGSGPSHFPSLCLG